MKGINPSGSGELLPAPADRRLTAAQFQTQAEMSAAVGMRPISPRSSSSWGMPIAVPLVYTIGELSDRKTRRNIKCGIRCLRPAGAVAVEMG